MAVAAKFQPRQAVRVQKWSPPGHLRTPAYVKGLVGEVREVAGCFRNPEGLAYGDYDAPEVPLYRVAFPARDVWPGDVADKGHELVMDLFEHWLAPAGERDE